MGKYTNNQIKRSKLKFRPLWVKLKINLKKRKHKNAVLKYCIFYSLTFSIVIVDVAFGQDP